MIEWQNGIVQIQDLPGTTYGTGFLVGEGTVVTCAHVLLYAGVITESGTPVANVGVRCKFRAGGGAIQARLGEIRVDQDLAVLSFDPQLKPPLAEAMPLADDSPKADLECKAFGHTREFPDGVPASCEIIENADHRNHKALLFRSEQFTAGFSGSPLWHKRQGVVGICFEATRTDKHGRFPYNAFARPVSMVRELLGPKPDCPYFGLESIEEESAKFYFGRDEAIAELVRKLADDQPNLVAVTGFSGSGKSSLVRAGILKAAEQSSPVDFGGRARALMTPGIYPLVKLLVRLRDSGLVDPELWDTAMTTPGAPLLTALKVDDFKKADSDNRALADLGADNLVGAIRSSAQGRMLIIIDQFEQLFTQTAAANRELFLDVISGLASKDIKVLLALRVDFMGSLSSRADYAEVVSARAIFLTPLKKEELREAIEKPALVQRRTYEAGVVDLLIASAEGKPGNLPLLQFTLKKLWEVEAQSPVITHSHLKTIGFYKDKDSGIDVVFAKQAMDVINKFPEGEKALVDRVLLHLVTQTGVYNSSDDSATTTAGRRAFKDEFSDVEWEVARKLADSFLLITGTMYNKTIVALAHESLTTSWKELAKLINDHKPWIRWHGETLAPLMEIWIRKGRSPDFVLPAGVLKDAKEKLGKEFPHLREGGIGILYEQSLRQERYARMLRIALFVGMPFALIAFLLYEIKQSQTRERGAQAGQLLAEAQRDLARKDYARAEIAAARALTVVDSKDVRETLLQARAGGVYFVADSRRAAPTAAAAPAVSASHALAHEKINLAVFSRDGILCAVDSEIAPDGHRAFNVTDATTLKVRWQVDQEAAADIGVPECVAFSAPQGGARYLACARGNHTIGVWELAQGHQRAALFRDITLKEGTPGKHEQRIAGLAFHPTKPLLASCGEDKKLCLWDYSAKPAKLVWQISNAHDTAVHGIAFNQDGSQLASGGGDYRAKVWNMDVVAALAASGNVLDAKKEAGSPGAVSTQYTLSGHTDSVFAVAFSPDGERLATGGYDRIIRIWDLSVAVKEDKDDPQNTRITHPTVATLYGHEGTVLDLFFGNDSKLLMSGSKDATARLWEVNEGRSLLTLSPDCGIIRSVAFQNFNDHIHCGGEGGWSIWSAEGRQEAVRLWNGGATVNSVAFDPQNELMAAGGSDGRVRVWDKNHRFQMALDPGVKDEFINGVAFSGDGRWLAAAGEGQTVTVWDRKQAWAQVTAAAATDSGKPLLKHEGAVWGLAFDPKGRWLASANTDEDVRIKLWSTAGWTLLRQSKPLGDAVYSLAVEPDGGWLASGQKEAWLRQWNTESLTEMCKEVRTVEAGEKNVWSVAICTDPLSVLSGNSDGHVYRWVAGTGKAVLLGTSADDASVNPTVNSVSYDSSRKWTAAGGDGNKVEIYDHQLTRVRGLAGHEGTIWWVTFSSDGSRLAYGGADRMVRVWNIQKLEATAVTESPAKLYEESQLQTGLTITNGEVTPWTAE